MQRGRSALNPFPEPFDLNQGALPENTSMDHSASWNNMLIPVESRFSNYMLGATDGNVTCVNTAVASQSLSSWDHGESSSCANNMPDESHSTDSKSRFGWLSASNACSGLDARSEDWSCTPSNTNNTSNRVNSTTTSHVTMQNLSSNGASMSLNLNDGQPCQWNQRGPGAVLPRNLYNSGHSAMDHSPTLYASSSNVGTFSGRSSTSSETYESAGPSFGSWGSSCKRKALEGSSRQLFLGGSSSSNPPMDRSIMQHQAHGCYTTSSTNVVEPVNPSIGVGMSRVPPSPFPSSSVPGVPYSSARHFAIRSNHGRHELVPFDTPRSTQARSSSVYTSQLSRPTTSTDSSELRSSGSGTLNQPHLMPTNEARGIPSYPWHGSFSSRGGSSSSSFVAGLQGSGAPEEVNFRSSRRNNLDYPMTVSESETRNVLPDQIDWSYAPGTSAYTRNHPSGVHIDPGSGGHTYSGALSPHQHQTSQNHQRLSEPFPWIPFHRDEAASTSRHQLDPVTAAFLMDIPHDDINGWRSLAGVDGRHRVIRQVLNAMRRGFRLQEDYSIFNPYMEELAELHDRHGDMRLDVDNMSYEELLALEEQIGNVSTGLSEEQIGKLMEQHKYEAIGGWLRNFEPCCICQDEYATGEDVGILDCGHEFHAHCIKQWLKLKNLCPICKMTALKT